jgi:hypothetical protein
MFRRDEQHVAVSGVMVKMLALNLSFQSEQEYTPLGISLKTLWFRNWVRG